MAVSSSKIKGVVFTIIGGLIAIRILTSLLGDFFGDLANTTLMANVPTWVVSTLVVTIAGGLVFLVWRLFME